jgi:hypothetical protein
MRTILVAATLLLLPFAAADGPGADVSTFTDSSSCEQSSSYSWDGGSYGPPPNASAAADPTPTPPPSTPPTAPPPSTTPTPTTVPVPTSTPPPYYGGWSRSSEQRSSDCQHEADTASASVGDDAGSIASARAYQRNASSSDSNHSSSSSWYDNGYSSWYRYHSEDAHSAASSQARGVEVEALGVQAGETSGCVDGWQSQGSGDFGSSSWQSGDNSSYSSSGWNDAGTMTRSSSCGDAVYAGVDGHGASAGDVSSCDAADQRESQSYNDGGSTTGTSGWRSSRSGSDACRSGLAAGADGNDAFAGSEGRCLDRSYRSDYASKDANGNASESGSSWSGTACVSGYAVEGPDGMRAAEGDSAWRSQRCTTQNYVENCTSEENHQQAITWTWDDSPVQALSSLWIGLPAPPSVLP